MKKTKLFLTTSILTMAMSSTAFAAGWTQEGDKWCYLENDGSKATDAWRKSGDDWFYLGGDGYMLVNTVTPDGFPVGANGAWITDTKRQANDKKEQSREEQTNIEKNDTEISTIVNVEGLAPQQDGYIVTYQYFNVFEEYGDAEYQAIIEIQNTGNGNLYLGTSTFDIYDRSGNIVSSETFISSDPDVIAPGQKGYFYSNGGYLDNVPVGDYVLKPRITVEKTNLPATRYVVGQNSMKMSKFGKNPTIVGTVTNNTVEDEGVLWIVAVFYDKNNLPIGICGTNILDFNAGITTGFELEGWHLPEYVTKDKISRYEIIAAPNQYQF